jgi:hypothetical protein
MHVWYTENEALRAVGATLIRCQGADYLRI